MLNAATTVPQRAVSRMDTFALTIGSKITASSLVLACVLCVVIGATSLLSSLEEMDRDLKKMSALLEDANSGLKVLNTTMDSLAPTTKSLDAIVVTVSKTSDQAKTSKTAISELGTTTTTLNEMLTSIKDETAAMSASEQELATSTEQLNTTLADLSTTVDPLAQTQNGMLDEVRTMKGGIAGMNGSLAYTIRSLNYMTAPPTGQSFSLQVELDKKALPPIPGVKAKADPVVVFPRGSWPVYTGP